MSAHGRALLAEWEGIRLHEYKDVGGNPSIGVGHFIRHDERDSGMLHIGLRRVPYKYGISREDAMALLEEDLRYFETVVANQVKVPLEEHQFDALVSFAFNVGPAHFIESGVLRRVNDGDWEAVPAKLRKWVNSGGVRVAGLVNRRADEISLWKGKI